jgi:outer membrane protein TolC
MRRPDAILGLIGCLLLGGCATSALKMAPERPDRPWAPAVSPQGDLVAGKNATVPATGGYVLPANPALAHLPPQPAIDAERAYTLPELIDLAESNNPDTRVAWNDARRAALAAGIAESAYLPRISAAAVGAYETSDGHVSALGTRASGSQSAEGVISAISMQWLLFDFGERGAVVDAAKQISLISNIAFTAAHQHVIHAVALAYYTHAAARSHAETAAKSLANAETVLAAADDRNKHGIGTVIETAQARQAVAQAQLGLVQAKGAEQDSYLTLLTAVGLPPLAKVRIAEIPPRSLSPAMAKSVDSIIADSLARRPDMASAYAAQKASLANVRAAKAEFLPKFFVSVTGAYNSGHLDVTALPGVGQEAPTVNVNDTHYSASVFAGVSVPLYDGGIRSANLARARAEVDSAGARLTRVRDEAVRDIVLSDNALQTSLAAHDAAQSLQAAAQTTFDASLAAYRNGVGSISELLIAENQLLQARNVASDSYSGALTAAANLALATGTLGSAP